MTDETREIRIIPEPAAKETHWYLLTGLVMGYLLGLFYAWMFNPVVYENTQPDTLKDNFKDTYRVTIAQVYSTTGNLERAALRLALLNDDDPVYALGAQAQRSLADGEDQKARSLALLASALQLNTSSQELIEGGTPNPTSSPTISPVPSQTLPPLTPMP